jgi:glutathione S-transferase
MQLYIGNKNYSSWSLRAWLLMTQLDVEFNERLLRLDGAEGSPFRATLLAIAPTGRVPLLVDDGFAVWDSLAIAEYLADRFPDKRIWPADRLQRARASCPMNIELTMPEVGARAVREWPEVAADLHRIDQMWSGQLAEIGGPFLFGAFGAVDAAYAPVCSRIASYGLPLGASSQAYLERILTLPAMLEWSRDARTERDFLEEDEPYRKP